MLRVTIDKDKEMIEIKTGKERRFCPICESGGRLAKENYTTLDLLNINEIPVLMVCSNGHLFSEWRGEK